MDYGLDPIDPIELESEPGSEANPIVVGASEPAPPAAASETPDLEVELGEKYGAAWFTQATAITNAEAMASQQANVGGSAALSSITTGELHRIRTDYLDTYQSRWSRDPGRANGTVQLMRPDLLWLFAVAGVVLIVLLAVGVIH